MAKIRFCWLIIEFLQVKQTLKSVKYNQGKQKKGKGIFVLNTELM